MAVAAAFEAVGVAGVVDEDSSHGLGGDSEEVGPAVELGLRLVDELEVGLVDEGGGLEGVPRVFAAEEGACQGAELVVDQGEKNINRTGIPVGKAFEESGDLLVHRLPVHLRQEIAPG